MALKDIVQAVISVLALGAGVAMIILGATSGNEALLTIGASMATGVVGYWLALPQNPPTFKP